MRIKIIITIILAFSFYSNKTIGQEKELSLSAVVTPGLVQAIHLGPIETKLDLRDYFPRIKVADSVFVNDRFIGTSIEPIVSSDNLLPINILKVLYKEVYYEFPMLKSDKQKVEFSFPNGDFDKLELKGEMNGWNQNATTFTKNGDDFITEFYLSPNEYQYLVIIDGIEQLDPHNSIKKSNGSGGFNSVFMVKSASVASELPNLTFLESNKNRLAFITQNATDLVAFWQNHKIPCSNEKSQYSFEIPKEAKLLERSYIRVWAMNQENVSQEILIPLSNGKIIWDVKDLNRSDYHSMVLYNVFVDRFNNGDTSNDRPTDDPTILPRANYHGGDIKGAIEKVKEGYFDSLGVNSIWISPIVKNPEGAFGKYPEPKTSFSAYHGYWPISFTEVDNRLTTEQDLKELVKVSHEIDQNVFLDFVSNHVHELHPMYQKNKDWATPLYLPDGSMNTERWDDHRLTTWFDVFLPTLDLARPEVYEMLSDSAVFWIKEYGFDGFRHDATKHVPEVFWKALSKKLKDEVIIPEERTLFQIGETYGTPELISSYVNTGQLDAQFDFNVYDAAVSCLMGNDSYKRLKNTIETSQKYYGTHHLMGNITGNQDRARFISYASGSLDLSESAKFAGWNRKVGVKDSVGYEKVALLNAIIATIPGIPVIYYGDEIGMSGGNDPDNRRMMRFDNLNPKEEKLKDITSQLMHFRRSSMPLIYGNFEAIDWGDEYVVFKRQYLDQFAYVFINSGEEDKSFTLNKWLRNSMMGSTMIEKEEQNSFELKSNSFEIWTNH